MQCSVVFRKSFAGLLGFRIASCALYGLRPQTLCFQTWALQKAHCELGLDLMFLCRLVRSTHHASVLLRVALFLSGRRASLLVPSLDDDLRRRAVSLFVDCLNALRRTISFVPPWLSGLCSVRRDVISVSSRVDDCRRFVLP